MKRSILFNTVRAGMLALSLTMSLVMSASAQSNAGGSTSTGSMTTQSDRRDDGTDWGWLGLLGLAGLLGLLPKRRTADADYRATDTATRGAAATR